MILIDELLKRAHIHRQSSQLLDLLELLILFFRFVFFFLLMEINELLLHQQIVLNALQLQLPQSTLSDWGHSWQLGRCVDPLALLFAAHSGRGWYRFFLGRVSLVVLPAALAVHLIPHSKLF